MLITKWHDWLDMPKHDKSWHEQDVKDEFVEYQEETKALKRWSELSDIAYTYTRARWSGHDINLPIRTWRFWWGLVYMFPKMTLRWWFFRRASKKAGMIKPMHEVRNPRKTAKLHVLAENYGLDPKEFQKICEKQLNYWILLP